MLGKPEKLIYKPSFSTLRNHMGPIYRAFAGDYVPTPESIRLDRSGNMYVLWRKKTANAALFNSLTVSDTTLHRRQEAYIYALTKFDARGTLLWARRLDNHYVLYPGGLEVAENGHVYVWGNFWGRYVEFEGVRLTQKEAEGFDGFVAHYDESGHLVRALHLETPAAIDTTEAAHNSRLGGGRCINIYIVRLYHIHYVLFVRN